MRRLRWVAILAVLTTSLLGQKVAILDLKPLGPIADSELQSLSERFRNQVVATEVFEVMERKDMLALDQEIALQLSEGFSEKAIAAAGKKKGAAFVVIGYVGKVRGTWTVDIKMVNCTSGQIDRTFSEDFKGDLDGLLGLMETGAKRIAGVKETNRLWLYLGGGGIVTAVTLAILLTQEEEPGLPNPPNPPSN